MITISKVTSKKDKHEFIDFPHELYKNDPNYVPELYIAQNDLLDPKKHPFFKHSKLDMFLAKKDGKVVGRIAAIRNNNHISYTESNDGFFGFFDVINDYKVAEKLLDTVKEWVKAEGLKAIIGPVNFSTNETCGMLIEGFDTPPVVMMTYNQEYTPKFMDKYGFRKKMDLIAYNLIDTELSQRTVEMMGKLEVRLKSKGITIRTANMKNFKSEIEKIKEIYNTAWEKNWGFVPMTDDEFNFMAKDMKMILDPDFCYIAEHNGKAVGFSLSIPDMNQVFIKVKKGRLLPTGLFKILFGKKKINKIRIITLGVIEEYRKMGIESCFYARNLITTKQKHITTAEASWILETNEMMNRAMININARPYKKYRMYEIDL